jgi:hypothetical protein
LDYCNGGNCRRYGFTEFPIEPLDILEDAQHLGLPTVPSELITFFTDQEFIEVGNKNVAKQIIYEVYSFLKRTFNGTRTLKYVHISF